MIFKMLFMMTKLKNFDDSLNFVVIVAPGREFFSAKYAQFLLTFTK